MGDSGFRGDQLREGLAEEDREVSNQRAGDAVERRHASAPTARQRPSGKFQRIWEENCNAFGQKPATCVDRDRQEKVPCVLSCVDSAGFEGGYRETSLPEGHYSRTMPRALRWSWGGAVSYE